MLEPLHFPDGSSMGPVEVLALRRRYIWMRQQAAERGDARCLLEYQAVIDTLYAFAMDKWGEAIVRALVL